MTLDVPPPPPPSGLGAYVEMCWLASVANAWHDAARGIVARRALDAPPLRTPPPVALEPTKRFAAP